MNNRKNTALGIIDAQRGFMPAAEGERLGLDGFGELPVPDGDTVVSALQPLIRTLMSDETAVVFTTQDWHPNGTAHFDEQPNFRTTWPTHCEQDTDGAKLHPHLEGVTANAFYKGDEVLARGEDDTSYSGFNARSFEDGTALPEFLENKDVRTLIVAGLALDYCAKATAIDFKTKTNMDVVVLTDATKPVAEETGKLAVAEMLELGIRFMTVEEVIQELEMEG